MGASAAPPDRGSVDLSVELVRRELAAVVAEDAVRKWPLAALYAPSIAAYELRLLSGETEGFVRAAIREIRDLFFDALHSTRQSLTLSGVDVLMLAMEPRQASNHYPMLAWLERNGKKGALLTGARRPAAVIDGSLSPVLLAEAIAGSGSLLRGMREARDLFRSYTAVTGQTLEREWILRRLRQRAGEGGRLFVRAAYILDHILPRIVVSCDDCDPRSRAILLEARRRGIPTLLMQYGMAGPYHVEWGHLAAEKVAVLGEQQADTLVAHGIQRTRLVVTGSPRFDAAVGLRTKDLPKAVLFASQPDAADCFGGEDRRGGLLRDVYAGLHRAGVEVIARPHPDENIEVHRRLIEALGMDVRFSDATVQSALSALSNCGTLVTFHSTFALEAALAGRRVIFYKPAGGVASPAAKVFVDAATQAGWANCVEGVEELALILTNPPAMLAKAEEIDRFAFNLDGKATERVGRLIMNQLGC